MSTRTVVGGSPLIGNVKLSGSKGSAQKLIVASMFSSEEIVLENVPRVRAVESMCEVVTKIGGTISWEGRHRLSLSGAGINTFEVPFVDDLPFSDVILLVAPLVFRFGKAEISKSFDRRQEARPVNRYFETWKSLGFNVTEDEESFLIEKGNAQGTNISFKTSTHRGTANAIISSIFIDGETFINNAAEEPELDDLIDFMNIIGASVERVEPKKIKVEGKSIFKGGKFTVQADNIEAVLFATAAVLTKGNISIEGIEKSHLTAFVNVLTKANVKYELSSDTLRVWNSGEPLTAINVTSSPSPGFLPDWAPSAVLLLTKAEGESTVYDTVHINNLLVARDLNRMGAKVELLRPSEAGFDYKSNDDTYDVSVRGEPLNVAKILGPVELKSNKLDAFNEESGPVLLIAALSADGKSEIFNFDRVEAFFEEFTERLTSLGAKFL